VPLAIDAFAIGRWLLFFRSKARTSARSASALEKSAASALRRR
jgi:hypothetical protein